MPSYTFRNTETGEEFDDFLTISNREKFLEENPHIIQLVSPIRLVAGHATKPDDGFRDILREIKKANKNSTVETF